MFLLKINFRYYKNNVNKKNIITLGISTYKEKRQIDY